MSVWCEWSDFDNVFANTPALCRSKTKTNNINTFLDV